MINEDTQFNVETIKEMEESYEQEGVMFCVVKLDGGGIILIRMEDTDVLPKAGDRIRLYGNSYDIRGIAVEENDEITRVFFYETKKEHIQSKETKKAKIFTDKVIAWKVEESVLRARISALPEVFQDRFARFEEHCGESWMAEHLTYELFTCEQGIMIHDADIHDYEALYNLPSEEVKVAIPNLSEEHSGNTFAASVSMARIYAQNPQFVPFAHAAIHGLLGCEEAGCWAGRHERTGEKMPEVENG